MAKYLSETGLQTVWSRIDSLFLRKASVDTVPTSGSTNLITSGGMYSVLEELEDTVAASENSLNTRLSAIEGMNLVTGTGLTADKLVLGNGNSTVKTSSKGITTTAPSSSSDDTTIPTSAAVNSAISSALGTVAGALKYKGTVASNSALPANHSVGDVYVVSTAGTFVGKACEVGDYIVCNTSGTAANNAHWDVLNGENQVSNASASLAAAGQSATIATVDGTNITVTTPSTWTGLAKTGTVTSVGMTVPTGLSVSGSPVTGSGTLAVSFASGYSIPTTAKQGNWDTAYGWGNHASAGYVKLDPGANEQTIKSSISSMSKGVVNLWRSSGDHYTFLGFSNGTTETALGGIGYKAQNDHNLYKKDGSNYYKIWDENNYTTWINTTNYPGLNSTGTITKVGNTSSGAVTVSSAGATIGTSDTTIATIGGVDIKAKIGTYLTTHQTIKQDGITGATITRFGTCGTAAATAAKAVNVGAGTVTLESGLKVTVKFTYANTANSPTLNVNSTGAKNIFHKGSQITSGTNKGLLAGTVDFVYDGTQWQLIGNYIDTNSGGTVTSVTLTSGTGITVSDSGTAITGSGSRTISLASGVATAGTYKSVTVDTYGRVTAGTNPTTLAGYGITDAKIASGVITLGSNTITPLTSHQTLTNHAKLADTSTAGQALVSKSGGYEWKTLGSNAYNSTAFLSSHQSLGLITASSATGTTENTTDSTNTTTFLNLLGGGSLKDSIKITGSTNVSVKSNGGVITITGPSLSSYLTSSSTLDATKLSGTIPASCYTDTNTDIRFADYFGESTTGASTVKKTTTNNSKSLASGDLVTGLSAIIYHQYANSGASATLNVGGSGDKAMYNAAGTRISGSTGTWTAKDIIRWVYDASLNSGSGGWKISYILGNGDSHRLRLLTGGKTALYSGTTLDSISDGSTRKLANYLPLSGGTMTGSILTSADNSNDIGTSSARFLHGNFRNIYTSYLGFRNGDNGEIQHGSFGIGDGYAQISLLATNGTALGSYMFYSDAGFFHNGNSVVPCGRSDHRWSKVWATDADLSGDLYLSTNSKAIYGKDTNGNYRRMMVLADDDGQYFGDSSSPRLTFSSTGIIQFYWGTFESGKYASFGDTAGSANSGACCYLPTIYPNGQGRSLGNAASFWHEVFTTQVILCKNNSSWYFGVGAGDSGTNFNLASPNGTIVASVNATTLNVGFSGTVTANGGNALLDESMALTTSEIDSILANA